MHIFDDCTKHGSIHHVQLWVHQQLSRVRLSDLDGSLLTQPVDECIVLVSDLDVVCKASVAFQG